jgi:AcrR family transcriptional regulator
MPGTPALPRPVRRERPAAPLSRERIVAAALALVDRDGLAALSMRKLGAELGVDPMAVYYHIPGKEALHDAIVEAVMAGIDLALDDPGACPEERILTAARAYLEAMLAHGNALPIVLARGPATPVALRPVELLVGILRDAGLPPVQAVAGMNAVAAAVRGLVGMAGAHRQPGAAPPALPPEQFPHLLEALACGMDLNADFEFGIRALARGLLAGAVRTGE